MKQKKEMEDILSRSSLKENHFGVPAGYFTSVQDEVMQKISAIRQNRRLQINNNLSGTLN